MLEIYGNWVDFFEAEKNVDLKDLLTFYEFMNNFKPDNYSIINIHLSYISANYVKNYYPCVHSAHCIPPTKVNTHETQALAGSDQDEDGSTAPSLTLGETLHCSV